MPEPESEIDERLADELEKLSPNGWEGEVWRHVFGDVPPSKPNDRGARWNPPGLAAIYTSLARDTVLAEAANAIGLQTPKPSGRRVLHRLGVKLSSVLDLTENEATLYDLGISADDLASLDWEPTQAVGAVAAWLGHDGLIVPSARHPGRNLVIFPSNRDEYAVFEAIADETIR